MRLGIVASRFNEAIAAELLKRAQGTARELGVESSVVSVPGALEIPLALQWMAQSGRFDALAAVGVVIRGETYHFEIVANESARGLMEWRSSSACRSPTASSPPRTSRRRSSASTRARRRCASRWRCGN